jgi:hypothetical protein
MVPGMFERDRLAAEARRAEWLDDAARQSVHSNRSLSLPRHAPNRHPARLLATILALVRRQIKSRPKRSGAAVGRATALGR